MKKESSQQQELPLVYLSKERDKNKMSTIKLSKKKAQMVPLLQKYLKKSGCEAESFGTEFLLDFFAKEIRRLYLR